MTPADFNASASVWVRSALNGVANTGVMSGPVNGYYTINASNAIVPAGSAILTGGVGYQYGTSAASNLPLTETDLSLYPYNTTNNSGGLVMTTTDVTMVATGYTARRTIIDNTKCQACHGKLGIDPQSPPGGGTAVTQVSGTWKPAGEPGFHAGQRNDGASCAGCHTDNLNTNGWAVGSKYFVHAIHGDRKRAQPLPGTRAARRRATSTSSTRLRSTSARRATWPTATTSRTPRTWPRSRTCWSRRSSPDGSVRAASRPGTGAPARSVALDQTGTVSYGGAFSFSAADGRHDPGGPTNLVISPIITPAPRATTPRPRSTT